jgi:hypothetical protein
MGGKKLPPGYGASFRTVRRPARRVAVRRAKIALLVAILSAIGRRKA